MNDQEIRRLSEGFLKYIEPSPKDKIVMAGHILNLIKALIIIVSSCLILISCKDPDYQTCTSNADCVEDALDTICTPYYRVEDCALFDYYCSNLNPQSGSSYKWINHQGIVKYKYMCIKGGDSNAPQR